jgi:Flp pilus assembly protein TadG
MWTDIFRKSNLHKDCRGAATVEFAIVAVSVIVLTPIIWDLAQVIENSMTLSGSMRAGVQYALANPNDSAGITQVIKTASGLSSDSLTVSTVKSCSCSGTTATCGNICAGGGNPAMYLAITANYSVPTMLPYATYPTNSFPITNSTKVRVQ